MEEYFDENLSGRVFENVESYLEYRRSLRKPLEELEFIWCLIGNIIDENYSVKDKVLRHGTKHFSPGTKVYCFPSLWGDGYENIQVIGRHRKSRKSILMVIPSKFVTNWRIQKVYDPKIKKLMHENYGWSDSENDKIRITKMLEWLPEMTLKFEIEEEDEKDLLANG